MEKNIETEYKLLVTKSEFELLLSFYPEAIFQKQVNTYFDNDKQQLRKNHGAMRIREKNDFIFTLKMPSSEGLLEYECFVDSSDVTQLYKPEVLKLLHDYDVYEPFHQTAQLVTQRAVINTGMAELCFDMNAYGNHQDYEIEYELTQPHDGITAFQNILKQANLKYEKNCDSKIKRALDALCK